MLGVSQFRKFLPSEYQSLSDNDIEEIRNNLYGLANIIFDEWKKDNNFISKKENL